MKKNAKPYEIVIIAQGQLLTVKLPVNRPRSHGGIRGPIADFSPASRKRLLELLATIDFSRAGYIVFVTLTYPDRDGPPSHEDADRDRDRFFKRIHRLFPNASGIWRREWVCRKSGDFTGVAYPHYHILLFNLPFVNFTDINDWWRHAIRYNGADLRTEIKGIRDKNHARIYLSKYIAKVEKGSDAAELEDIDVTAAEGGGDGSPERRVEGADAAGFGGGDGGCSLVYDAYLTQNTNTDNEGTRKRTGRHWGKFNRKRLPLGNVRTLFVEPGPWVVAMREAAGQVYAPAGEANGDSFTLFVGNASEWLDRFKKLAEGGCDDSL